MNAPTYQALQQAAQWHALLESGRATDADRQRWQAWLEESEQHRQAWHYAQKVSARFANLQGNSARLVADAYQRTQAHRTQRRQLLGALAAVGVGAAVAWPVWRFSGLRDGLLALGADRSSPVGQVRQFALEDGSRAWLGSASAVDLDFAAGLRRVVLLRGEVLLQTAKAASGGTSVAATLEVQTVHGRLQPMGTRFSVRLEAQRSLLAVFEGAVRITTADGGQTAIVPAGRQTWFDALTIASPAHADPNREAWTRGLFIARRTPLQALVTELRHHYRGHIGLAPQLRQLPVVGSYPVTDPLRALRMLERSQPIRVRQTLPWWLSVEPA